MGIVRLETKEQLEAKCKELFAEGEARDMDLCRVLGLDYCSSDFYTEILPRITELVATEQLLNTLSDTFVDTSEEVIKSGNGLANWAGELEQAVRELPLDKTSYIMQCADWVRSQLKNWKALQEIKDV